ncbi:unnamed protein product [Periconia digitata]|uniref:Aminoglycoside phosphotransferase domain-containing protein n=1 Tax=Periconia digitata TaxID=1303443 RepID=A0A9W4UJS1_9PLEO|nr:unnamed protein product [Periconia digitata]
MSSDFWTRAGLDEKCQNGKETCMKAIKELYSTLQQECKIEEFTYQGWCSYTLRVTHQPINSAHGLKPSRTIANEPQNLTTIVQIRPSRHSLSLSIVAQAKETYGTLAPTIHRLPVNLPANLKAFAMNLLPGIPASAIPFPPSTKQTTPSPQRITLITSLAKALAATWPSSPSKPSIQTPSSPQRPRADSPISSGPVYLTPCTGPVGSQILPKLHTLSRSLPSPGLRAKAAETLTAVLNVSDTYPTVLNHGDLIPSNILVDPRTHELTGLVDWAEAEVLPFGVCFYGVDRLLGEVVYSDAEDGRERVFRYAGDAEVLREVFWDTLTRERAEVRKWEDEIRVMRDVGVLLWCGFAWDGGKIDRVVEEGADGEEVACLRAFLGVG